MIRVFFGVFFLIFGTPLFVYCLMRTDTPAMSYFMSALFVTIGLVCLYPRRWVD